MYSALQALPRFARMLILFSLFTSSGAWATLDLNGVSYHKEYGEEQYMAALYLEDLSGDAKEILLSDQRKRMEIKVVADRLFSRKFTSQWIEGVAINAGNFDLKKHAENLAKFSNMLKVKLVKNDTLTIERTFRRGVEVSLNGVMLGSIEDKSFFDLILRSWIGPVPLSAEFKSDLLQAGSIEPARLAKFKDIRTTPARVAALTAAIGATSKPATKAASDEEKASSSEVAVVTSSEAVSQSSTETAVATTGESSVTASSESTVAVVQTNQSSSSSTAPVVLTNQIVDEDDIFEDEEEEFSYTAADLLSRQLYLSKLTRWTGGYIRYPKTSLRRNEEGTVRVTVTIDRAGKVIDHVVVNESEYKRLNQEAIKAIKRASPYPAMPDIIKGDTFEFTLPVVFALRAPE